MPHGTSQWAYTGFTNLAKKFIRIPRLCFYYSRPKWCCNFITKRLRLKTKPRTISVSDTTVRQKLTKNKKVVRLHTTTTHSLCHGKRCKLTNKCLLFVRFPFTLALNGSP